VFLADGAVVGELRGPTREQVLERMARMDRKASFGTTGQAVREAVEGSGAH
jgi:hypothetical protein